MQSQQKVFLPGTENIIEDDEWKINKKIQKRD